MILVTGATGNVGNALVQDLASRDEPVRGLAQNPDRARFPSTVDVVSADLETPEGVVPTLGPQPLTPSEQVGTLARVLARPLRYEPMTDQEARSQMQADTPASLIDAFFRFFTGGEFDDASVVELRPGDHGPPSPHIRAVGPRPRPRLNGWPMTGRWCGGSTTRQHQEERMATNSGARSDSGRPSPNKQLVHRLVDDVINARRFESLDGLATSRLAPKLRTAFEQFRAAFPDWHQELVELVEEGDTVVARFRCTGTQATDWQGLTATGRAMDVDEVSFIRITDGRISGIWGLEDTWTRIRQLVGDDVTVGELGSLG